MKRTPGFSAGADYEVTSSLNIKQFPEFFRETILPNVIYAFQLAGYYISCAFINVRYFLMTLSPRNLTALILAAAIPVLAIVSLIVSSFQGGSAQPASPLAAHADLSNDIAINITDPDELESAEEQIVNASSTVSLSDISATNTVSTMPNAEITLGVGETIKLDGSNGYGTSNGTFRSECPMIASVDPLSGVVTARNVGAANITCAKGDGSKTVCRVTVKPLSAFLALEESEVELEEDEQFDFNSLVVDGSASYFRNYYSEDPNIASVTMAGGLMTARNRGTTRIYCENAGGVRAYANVTVKPRFRGLMVRFLREQLGRHVGMYVKYINEQDENLGVTEEYSWCAIFAWCALDQFCNQIHVLNPVEPCIHVSEIARPARELGAVHLCSDPSYTPKPGDIFTTATVGVEGDDGYQHIGYIESVELDDDGNVVKVYTIEGNYDWESTYTTSTEVSRGVWVPGETNEYGDQILEYIDLEQFLDPWGEIRG